MSSPPHADPARITTKDRAERYLDDLERYYERRAASRKRKRDDWWKAASPEEREAWLDKMARRRD